MTDKGLGAFSLVIFDWAGTMVDFGCRAPVAALVEAFARHDVRLDEAAARADMGKAKIDHVRALLARPEVRGGVDHGHGRRALRSRCGGVDGRPRSADAGGGGARRPSSSRARRKRPRACGRRGSRSASSTGYTREMMTPVLARAAAQGYAPDHLVCSGETPEGRPSPLMIYKACAELGVWPLARVVKVDDAEAGIAEGRAAGCFTVGVSASGNGIGLSQSELAALDPAERGRRLAGAEASLKAAGADLVIETVADLIPALNRMAARETADAGAPA